MPQCKMNGQPGCTNDPRPGWNLCDTCAAGPGSIEDFEAGEAILKARRLQMHIYRLTFSGRMVYCR